MYGMNSSAPFESEPASVPRWIAIPVGIVLGLFLLPCLIGSASLILVPAESAPIARPIGGAVLIVMCCWSLEKCFRLVTNKRNKGGLLSQRSLRAVGWLFLLLPVGGLVTGYFQAKPVIAVVQTAAYISIFFGVRRLASERESNAVQLSVQRDGP